MGDSGAIRPTGASLTRREFLHLGTVATVAALVPTVTAAAPPSDKKPGGSPPPTPFEDPYTSRIPLVFPLSDGTYRKPLRDNWHDNREGAGYSWSHQNGDTQRAHDGVDIFPRFATSLPTAYAPLSARVAGVYIASADGGYYENRDTAIAPPLRYPQSPDPGANIYGSYLWLYSIDANSAGYFVFYCHLKTDDPFLRATAENALNDTTVNATTPVGTMGDTGNASGQPQLHVELHLPQGSAFSCKKCLSVARQLTAVNPFPSLSNAAAR